MAFNVLMCRFETTRSLYGNSFLVHHAESVVISYTTGKYLRLDWFLKWSCLQDVIWWTCGLFAVCRWKVQTFRALLICSYCWIHCIEHLQSLRVMNRSKTNWSWESCVQKWETTKLFAVVTRFVNCHFCCSHFVSFFCFFSVCFTACSVVVLTFTTYQYKKWIFTRRHLFS